MEPDGPLRAQPHGVRVLGWIAQRFPLRYGTATKKAFGQAPATGEASPKARMQIKSLPAFHNAGETD